MKLAHVGDVLVTPSDCTNPYTYRGPLYSGEERKLALLVFEHDGLTDGLTLWHAPADGGARRITREEVVW